MTPKAGPEPARHPSEVPAALAEAALAFCERADRPASPSLVRRALAQLSPEEEAALSALLARPPPARPLGPWALVEVVRGLDPDQAAARELAGYYLKPRARSGATRRPRVNDRRRILTALEATRGDLASAAKRLEMDEATLSKRIRQLSLVRKARALARPVPGQAVPPKVRARGQKDERPRPHAPAPPPWPKRAVQPPRGRIVLGPPARRELGELEGREGKRELRQRLREHHGDASRLQAWLNRTFRVRRPLGPPEVQALLARQGLEDEARRLQIEQARFVFAQARGDLADVSRRLRVERGALQAYLETLGLWSEAERARDRYRREVFGWPLPRQVRALLGRGRYLRELGAQAPLERQLREDVGRNWEVARQSPAAERAAGLAKRLGVEAHEAAALIERFRLR